MNLLSRACANIAPAGKKKSRSRKMPNADDLLRLSMALVYVQKTYKNMNPDRMMASNVAIGKIIVSKVFEPISPVYSINASDCMRASTAIRIPSIAGTISRKSVGVSLPFLRNSIVVTINQYIG